MNIEQLVSNAIYPNPSQLTFALRRSEDTLRGASYYVESRTPSISLLLKVCLLGNITASMLRDHGYVSNGEQQTEDDWQPICWSDSNNIAVIQTDLSRDDIVEPSNPQKIMQSYFDAITLEKDALCQGGYSRWSLQIQLFVDMLAQKYGQQIELDMVMPKTTCPGMEHSLPWMPPFHEVSIIHKDSAEDLKLTDEEEAQLLAIHEECCPRVSCIELKPPFMVRTPMREIIHSRKF